MLNNYSMTNDDSPTYIIILNWNGWKDTVECLESVFRLKHDNYRVIVCDNASTDGSIEYIKSWAEGQLDIYVPQDNPLRQLSFPPVSKTIPYKQYERKDAESGGNIEDNNYPLIIIQTGDNLGFAGGNNVGLKYAIAQGDFAYIWLLNNDTVVEARALSALVKRMQEKPNAGICGSTLMYYNDPKKIQALGGAKYNKWLATVKHIDSNYNSKHITDTGSIEDKIDYVVGASMHISKKYIDEIGLLSEDYFIYFEEIDWAIRAKGKFEIAYAPDSFVYHKEGASIGTSSQLNERSDLSDYYNIRNRVLITKKYFKNCITTVYLGIVATAINRLRRGQWVKAKTIIRLLCYKK